MKERHLPENCRQGVTELLKDTYGYDHFRNLEIYADLFRSRETLCIDVYKRQVLQVSKKAVSLHRI